MCCGLSRRTNSAVIDRLYTEKVCVYSSIIAIVFYISSSIMPILRSITNEVFEAPSAEEEVITMLNNDQNRVAIRLQNGLGLVLLFLDVVQRTTGMNEQNTPEATTDTTTQNLLEMIRSLRNNRELYDGVKRFCWRPYYSSY